MRRTPLLHWLLFLLMASVAWAQVPRVGERLGVVLSAQGVVEHSDGGRPASIRKPLRVLDVLGEGDVVYLAPKARITLSLLASGVRYDLKGPLELFMTGREPLHPGPGVSELEKQSGREGILATQNVDLSKFGGTSSRSLAKVFVDDGDPPVIDLHLRGDLRETSTLKVLIAEDRPDSPWVEHPAVVIERSNGHDQVQISNLRPEVGKPCYIFLGDGIPTKDGAFLLIRLPLEDLTGVREVEKAAIDLPSKVELYECYLHHMLYTKARRLLAQMAREYPGAADWSEVTDGQSKTPRRNP